MRHFLAFLLLCFALIGQTAVSQKPDRSQPPVIGPPPMLHLGAIQHLKLANGIPVVLYEKHDVPLAEVSVIVRTGAINDPEGKAGLASMVASMMTEGAGRRTALEVADAVDYLGAQLNAEAGNHTFGVSVNTPVATLDSALVLMADVLLRPAFPAAELERQRADRLTTLLQWRDDPNVLASILCNRALFGNHPYGIPSIGTVQSIRSFTTEDLRSFHAAHFGANLATIAVVGDVTPKALMQKLNAAFGAWKPVKASPYPVLTVPQVQGRRILLVDKPDAPQTAIRIGRIGAARLTEDFFAINVMNTILGGSFTSRLNHTLREVHGYTYGAHSMFDFRPLPGPFVAAASVQTQVTDSSLVEFMKELRGIGEPVPPADLERGKNYIALSYPTNFQTVSEIVGQLEDLVIYDLPDSYFNDYIGSILAITQGQVQAAARKYVDTDNMIIVLVGDRTSILPKVDALHLGPISVLSVDDILGAAPVAQGQ